MYVIYHGKGNSILTSIAAALHLEEFSFDPTQPKIFLNILPTFCSMEEKSIGRLVQVGRDQANNNIFILSTSTAETIMLPALTSVFDILQIPQQELYLADISEIGNIKLSVGIWLYKKNFLKRYAERLIFQGIKAEHNHLLKVVEKTKIFSKKD
ncbi:DUF3189 family protein [Alkaliphilus transvaalensis]|uniref:DUF3189 family protein n=1 Tax=Alkaliphilus transvaalensis TaxID=114628 RepID=UPI00047E3C1D|nr:DUF3189 family protein [Alkaliphilus transvaalensis]